MYVADPALARVFVYGRDGALRSTVDGIERPAGLACATALARLYVADAAADRITVHDADGRALFAFDARSAPSGGFNSPTHLFATEDRLYVSDTMNFRIQVFGLDGGFRRMFGEHGDRSGYMAHPKGVAVDGDGNV